MTGCFGLVSDPARHYYTLHLEPLRPIPTPKMPGLIRIRDLDSESAYDRFQIVIRRSPFELVYRQKDVWAVKPNRMVSDIIARGLANQNVFSSVTRELSERRPQYFMSGELHAIEVYDSGNTWFAHLAMALQITHFETGKILWSFSYDNRKEVQTQNFAVSVRALSELVSDALERALISMDRMHPVDVPAPTSDLAPSEEDDTPGGTPGGKPGPEHEDDPERPAMLPNEGPSGRRRDPDQPVLVPQAPHKPETAEDDNPR